MRVVKDTPFEFGHLVWQVRPPTPSLTLVIKGTFDIVPGEPLCHYAPKQRPSHGDAHFDDDPAMSLQFDSDLAVNKPRGECFVAGTCHAPGGRPVDVASVSFAIGPVRKTLGVVGDRQWTRFGGLSEPAPFTAMPLRWERSFGGPGFSANPVGAGLGATLPNLEDSDHMVTSPQSRPRPAGFFPIAKHWEARARRTGSYEGDWLHTRWPWFPADFDWEFFNAAPADQRIDGFWRGDEAIALQGMHPEHQKIETRLPGTRARAFLAIRRGEQWVFEEVPLRLDTITVDADALQVYCLWRGLTEVSSERLDDVSTLFYFHEPLDSYSTIEEAYERYTRKLQEEQDEKDDLEIVALAPLDAEEPSAEAPAGPDRLTSKVMAALAPSFEAMGLSAKVLHDFLKEPSGGAPPSAGTVKQSLEAEGQDVPPEVAAGAPIAEAALTPPTAQDEEAALPEADAALSREGVLRHRAAEGSFAGLDLTGADLSDLDLRGADFTDAIMTRVNLSNADVREAIFDGATLAEANLSRCDLRAASFVEADLAEVQAAGARFDGAVLDGITGENGRWVGASLEGASMQKADLSGSDFTDAVFRTANLSVSEFQGSTLTRCDFTEAVLDDTSVERALATECHFDRASMKKFRASEGADLRRSTFVRAQAAESAWARSNLDETDFTRAVLTRADFAEVRLVAAKLHGVDVSRARFDNAEMTGVSMLEANALEASFEGARLSHADLRGANLFGAQLWRAQVDGAQTVLANLERTHLEGRDG